MQRTLSLPPEAVGLATIFMLIVVGTGTGLIAIFVEAQADSGSTIDLPVWAQVGFLLLLAFSTAGFGVLAAARARSMRLHSAAIRDRVRSAEQDLSRAIEHAVRAVNDEQRHLDEALLLSRVWQSVTARLSQYHDDAQSQGRRAFNAAMTAMWVGFAVTAGCGAVAVFLATTNTGAVVVGALGAVSAALSGYVARTHLRAYEAVSGQLQGYFSQPVEASRYLSAERAIHVSGLSDEARRDLMKSLVAAMVAPPARDGGPST